MNNVSDLLRARGASGSMPGARDDGARIALCIEGGAMRGVIAGGMLTALEDLGLSSAFDAVYGSSAGAIGATYFLSRQASLGVRIYTEDINNRRFANRARLFLGEPIVNLSVLVDDVMVRVKPLETKADLNSPTPVPRPATDVGSVEARSV